MFKQIILMFCILLGLSVNSYADEAGTALAQAVYDRPNGDDNISIGQMVLQEPGKEPRTRKMIAFGKDKGGGNTLNLIRFKTPADINGIGMLTLDYPGDKSDQWLFLPDAGKVRRVPTNRLGGKFVGSDLYNEDLRDREVNMDTHTITGEDKIKGLDVKILESIPVDKKNSSYSKRISWVSTKVLLPLKVEFYQKGKLVKRAEAAKLEKKQGFWTVMVQKITDMKTKHTTRTIIQKITYDVGLPDAVFTQQVLEDPQRDQEYLKGM